MGHGGAGFLGGTSHDGHRRLGGGVARGFVERGFRGDVLTGAKYRGLARAPASFLALPPEAD